MENDKQINGNGDGSSKNAHDLEQTKRFFLSEELLVKSPQPEVYSLADEYAKSKRNKSYWVYLLILSYIAAMGIGVFLIDKLEENKNKRVEVNIAEFRQFNLIELLREQKENEEKLVKLQQELAELRISSKKELEKLAPHSQQKMLAAANEKIQKLEEAYNQEIKSRQEAIDALQKTIAAEKQRMGAKAQAGAGIALKSSNVSGGQIQEAALEKVKAEYEARIARLIQNQRKELDALQQENEKLIDTLTLRYNPIFSQGEMAAIIGSKPGNTGNRNLNKYLKILADENIYSEPEFNSLRAKIRNRDVIIANLLGIPYTNSVPPALNRLDQLSNSITSDYETLWTNLAQRLKEKNDYISGYNIALNYLSATRGESGYIIDARDPNRLIVFINHIYSVKPGTMAYIYKNEDRAIAKIQLNPERNRITARVIASLSNDKIEPFDRILLKLEVSQ
jgi:hypothetical protein